MTVEASVKIDRETSHNEYENSFSRDANMKRDTEVDSESSLTKTRSDSLIAELSIDVVRYEAYLDEISPNTIIPEFLDDFKILPTSFYTPDSPKMFDDFIKRWGTHVVKVRD